MKKVLLISFVFVLFASKSFAGGYSYFVIAFSDEKSAAVSLSKRADYLSMPLNISSKEKDPNTRFAEIRQAQDLFFDRAKKTPDIIIHKGPITLSPKPLSKLSSYSYGRSSEAQFHILAKFKENEDVYDCESSIRKIITSIKMPGRSNLSPGQIQLTVMNPEQYRKELLEKISQDVAFVKSTIGAEGKAIIKGLDRPVLVRQIDDKNVELFINYELTIEMSNKAH